MYVRRISDGALLSTYPGGVYVYGNYTSGTMPTDVELWNRMASRIRGHDFDLAVALGEGHETVKMIASKTMAIARSLLALRRGNVRLAIKQLSCVVVQTHKKISYFNPRSGRKAHTVSSLGVKDVASVWLELQYGWKPLLSDIAEGFAAFRDRSFKPRFREISVSKKSLGAWEPSTNGTNLYFKSYNRKVLTLRMVEDLPQTDYWQVADPAVVAWELVPFSFVADWFLPIGDYLQARAFRNRVKGQYAFSRITLTEYEFNVASLYCGAAYKAIPANGGRYYRKNLSYSRDPLVPTPSTLPGAAGSLNFPGFNPWVQASSLGHMKNAIALLTQLTARSGKAAHSKWDRNFTYTITN
jgi:hypothetical protein